MVLPQGVYSSLLSLLCHKDRLAPGQAELSSLLLQCAVGQVYDSGPVDFTSEAVSVRQCNGDQQQQWELGLFGRNGVSQQLWIWCKCLKCSHWQQHPVLEPVCKMCLLGELLLQ